VIDLGTTEKFSSSKVSTLSEKQAKKKKQKKKKKN
jgi:hypothetical protein